jgi:hypothetical protein
VVDNTGLKVFGEGEWLENKHKTKVKRKRWRKLHLGLDLSSGEIICSDLTTDDVTDPTALRDLLDRVDVPVNQGEGADGLASLQLLQSAQPGCDPDRPMEGRHWSETSRTKLRKSADRS